MLRPWVPKIVLRRGGTVALRPQRRLRLLALAEQFGFAILEDDFDHELHVAHRPLRPLASVDRHGKVIYVGIALN